ncbi:hypothetical protein BKA64DRAFT_185837 [Cadophora sp. MPI-SDFR-AT-0126]|nr:hypothetical protein BKA64DRAFT_185837 [Leotiomycetes sp. MPI-SDFR-AT-0126]
MQTSVRSEAPRPADVKSLSDESVQVSREVSVVSTRAPTPSIIPAVINEYVPAEFAPGITSVTAQGAQLNRWNSRISDRSWRNSRRTSSQAPQISQDASMLHSNRESMKALSDFLMTRDPPPNNFMSIPSDDEESLSPLKKTAFRFFGKQKKSAKTPRLMQLPDSAVAAQTRSGARHIAISIPMEHDHSRAPTPVHPPNPLRSHPPMNIDRSAVTVLKSVAEVRESASTNFRPETRSRDSAVENGYRPQSAGARSQKEKNGIDTTRIMSAYHPDSVSDKRQARVEPSPARYDQRPQRSYIAVSPTHHQDSQRVDLRHSGGTIYSQMSFASTGMGHSRNISSVSTAPSATLISSLKLDLPPRTSSISKVPVSIQKELAIASMLAEKAAEEAPASPTKSADSEAGCPSPPAIYGIAVRGYNASPVGRPQVVNQRSHISHLSADVPSHPGAQDGMPSRPWTAPPPRTKHLTVPRSKETVKRTASSRDGNTESLLVTRQSRQEKVRARKLRDLESVQPHSSPRRPLSEAKSTSVGQNTTHVVAPPRNPKRGLHSGDGHRRRATINTLSPIMIVANLPPYTGYVTKMDLPLQHPSRQSRSGAPNSPESTAKSTHTPPRSITTSVDSDTDADNDATQPTSSSSKNKSNRRSPTQSLRSSVLSTRRQERRAKRNMSLREKEMDARMSKIESDNLMLLQTLGSIARSFGEISRIGKETRGDRKTTARLLDEEWMPSEEEKRRRVELQRMEPFMREMQVLAPRVSMEIHRLKKDGEEAGEDSDDAMSILG